jgi:hypothetical protein
MCWLCWCAVGCLLAVLLAVLLVRCIVERRGSVETKSKTRGTCERASYIEKEPASRADARAPLRILLYVPVWILYFSTAAR